MLRRTDCCNGATTAAGAPSGRARAGTADTLVGTCQRGRCADSPCHTGQCCEREEVGKRKKELIWKRESGRLQQKLQRARGTEDQRRQRDTCRIPPTEHHDRDRDKPAAGRDGRKRSQGSYSTRSS